MQSEGHLSPGAKLTESMPLGIWNAIRPNCRFKMFSVASDTAHKPIGRCIELWKMRSELLRSCCSHRRMGSPNMNSWPCSKYMIGHCT
eukprot:8202168-Pyramimonas_sp.AAC.1